MSPTAAKNHRKPFISEMNQQLPITTSVLFSSESSLPHGPTQPNTGTAETQAGLQPAQGQEHHDTSTAHLLWMGLHAGHVAMSHTQGGWVLSSPIHLLFFPLVASFSFSLLVQLLHEGAITRFPCSSNSCCFDSSLNPALMLTADDRQRKQQLHFRGQYITSVYCLQRPPCRASGISSTSTDTSLKHPCSLLSLSSTGERRKKQQQ